jgi:nicotinamidase-related amidase
MEATWAKNQEIQRMRILKDDCAGLVIDVQEKLFRVIDGGDRMLERILILLEGLKMLGIPVLLTEQYPKGLGKTVAPVGKVLGNSRPVEKMVFSCCDEPEFQNRLKATSRKTVIICGIEAHVCVLQTVADLRQEGYLPVVIADGTGSRNPVDKQVALERMQAEGALISTMESILFELVRKAGTDLFRAISRLVK